MKFSSFETVGQQNICLTIKNNPSKNSFGVYAKTNFTQSKFRFSSAQISIVLPTIASNDKLTIHNVSNGNWVEKSKASSPEVDCKRDYIGLWLVDGKYDFIANEETLLFEFSLNKKVLIDEVRLFENKEDPKASELGMKSIDFSNLLIDEDGNHLYKFNYFDSNNSKKNYIDTAQDVELVLNPTIVKNNFNIFLKGVEENDEVSLLVVTERGTTIINTITTNKNIIARVFRVPDDIPSQNLIVRVKVKKTLISKRLVLARE
ncbi:hypothetical protein [Emticicia aquatica]|nr:hypothetical protein [Emticicia aquatica]